MRNDFDKENIFGLGNSNDAYKKYFIGKSYLNMLAKVDDDKTKKVLNEVKLQNEEPTSYLCKTENGEHIIGHYILNKDFEPIAYIPSLENYKNGKLILQDWTDYYEVPMYTEKEIIKKAKEYLESKGKI